MLIQTLPEETLGMVKQHLDKFHANKKSDDFVMVTPNEISHLKESITLAAQNKPQVVKHVRVQGVFAGSQAKEEQPSQAIKNDMSNSTLKK